MKTSFASIAAALALVSVACSSSSSTTPADAGSGGSGDDAPSNEHDASNDVTAPTEDAGVDSNVPSTDAGTTFLRLINLSPDSPGIDFCYAPQESTDYHGPAIGTAAGIAYGQGSAYLAFPANSYAVRAVAAGSTDCKTPIGSADTPLSTLLGGEYTSLIAVGDVTVAGSDVPFDLFSFGDDLASSTTGQAAIRFINASPSITPADFGLGTAAASSFQALYTKVATGSEVLHPADDAGAPDDNSYLSIAPLANATVSARPNAQATDSATATGINVAAGKAATFFLVGAKTGDAAHPARLVSCDDSAPPANGLSACSFVSN